MSAYNQLDLQTLGSQPVIPKNLPDHCLEGDEMGGSALKQILRALYSLLMGYGNTRN